MRLRMHVEQEGDCVVVVFSSRQHSIALNPEQARGVARDLFDRSDEAKAWVDAGGSRKLLTSPDRWTKYGVQAKDEKVWLYFTKPTDRECMPYEAAKELARNIIKAIQDLGLRP